MPEAADKRPFAASFGDALQMVERVGWRLWRLQCLPGIAPGEDAYTSEPPAQPNVIRGDDPMAAWLGPREWLIGTSEREADTVPPPLRNANGPDWFACDMSDGIVTFDVTGTRATEILAADCPVDLEGPEMGHGRCAQTVLAQVPVLVYRTPGGQGWTVHVERPLARHVFDWLSARAARAFRLSS